MERSTWLQHYGLKEYPKQLRVKGTEAEIITPDEITTTGHVRHGDGMMLNIWWYEPVFIEPELFETKTPLIKLQIRNAGRIGKNF